MHFIAYISLATYHSTFRFRNLRFNRNEKENVTKLLHYFKPSSRLFHPTRLLCFGDFSNSPLIPTPLLLGTKEYSKPIKHNSCFMILYDWLSNNSIVLSLSPAISEWQEPTQTHSNTSLSSVLCHYR